MAWQAALALGAALAVALTAACAPSPKLRAAWYLGAEAASDPGEPSPPRPSAIVVTVLNVGLAPADIREVTLNAADGPSLWRKAEGEASLLGSGAMLVLPASLPVPPATCGAHHPVILPVRVFVRTRERPRRPLRIDIKNPMPSTLADDWWPQAPEGCR